MTDVIWLKEALGEIEAQMRGNSREGLKAGAHILVKDAMKVLVDIRMLSQRKDNTRELREKCFLLGHYLDYLDRLCEEMS